MSLKSLISAFYHSSNISKLFECEYSGYILKVYLQLRDFLNKSRKPLPTFPTFSPVRSGISVFCFGSNLVLFYFLFFKAGGGGGF